MYESKGGLCCFNLKSGRFPSIDFHSFFRYLATESMGPKPFPVVLFAKAANYFKLTKFRCFKNRTAAHGCEFLFTMIWSLLHLIFEGKMQNHLEATRSIWTLKLPLCSEPVCHSHQFPDLAWQAPFSILDPRSSILASRFPILDSQFSILHSRFSILDPRSRILDPRFPILDPRYSNLASRFSIRMEGPLAHTLVRYRETLSESWKTLPCSQ